jgi:ABC-type transport system involved in cytochrome c biogenesis permease subunit
MTEWFNNLSDKWKASLRTAWQSLMAAVAVLVIAALKEAGDLLNGGLLADSVDDMTAAARILGFGVITITTGLVSLFMNRGDRGAKYDRGETSD